MASAQKKVVVRRFEGSPAWGYLAQEGFRQGETVELMAIDGRSNPIRINEIKWIATVRDFNLDDTREPERLGRKTFRARPRGDGVWLRLRLLDGDTLEGLADLGLGLLDTAIMDGGLFLTPPDARGNTLRLFVPRSALTGMEVLGWVTAPSRKAARAKPIRSGLGDGETQATLFE
jgi:hypothetical protein